MRRLHQYRISPKSLPLIAAQNILLVMVVVYNANGKGLDDFASLCNVTMMNLGLFVPLGIFLMCGRFNGIPAYQIRFGSKRRWLVSESKGTALLLAVYTAEYLLVGASAAVLCGTKADFTRGLWRGLMAYAVSEYLFLLTLWCFMLLLYVLFGWEFHQCGYLLYAAAALLYIAEVIAGANGAVTPLYHTDVSLGGQLAVLWPRLLALACVWLVVRSAAGGQKRHIAWYAVRFQNYGKAFLKLLGVMALLLSLFLLTAYGGGLNKTALFEVIFLPQSVNAAFVSLYTGWVAALCLIPFHYIENANPADCKELALRINSRRKLREMMLRELLLLILSEFAAVGLMVFAGGLFLRGSGVALAKIAATFLLYAAAVYLAAIWRYQSTASGGRLYWLYAGMIVFHLNNVYAFLPPLSAVHVLKNGSGGEIGRYVALAMLCNAVSVYWIMNGKKENHND